MEESQASFEVLAATLQVSKAQQRLLGLVHDAAK